MNTDQLSYFTVLYANRSFALAAKRIPITAQGLIRAIRRLETELDVPLFDIDDAGVPHPTPYADILNKYLRRWNRDWLSLQEQFARLKAQAIQEVRLGASMGVLGIFGSGFIEGFERAHPGITLNLKEFDDESLDKGLRNEFYDMAITLHPFDETLVTTELFSTAIGFWVPKTASLPDALRCAWRTWPDRPCLGPPRATRYTVPSCVFAGKRACSSGTSMSQSRCLPFSTLFRRARALASRCPKLPGYLCFPTLMQWPAYRRATSPCVAG